jgi:excisionase family DNA binding protein
MDEPRFLTPAEAAAELRVSSDTILRLINSGLLPAIRVSPRVIRIPKPAFESFRSGHKPTRRQVILVASEEELQLGAGEGIPERTPTGR